MSGKEFEDRWGHLRDLVEHMFQDPAPGMDSVVWYPATDVHETDERFVVRMDISGVRRSDIQIRMENQVIVVEGQRTDPAPGTRRTFHKMEIARGPFARSIKVPERFAGAEAAAAYEDGILEIALTNPKRRRSKRIVIVEIH